VTDKPEFTEFAKTIRARSRPTSWIKTIPEYEQIVKIYDGGRGTFTDVDGNTQPVTATTIHRWLVARGYSPETCNVGKIKHWCDAHKRHDQ